MIIVSSSPASRLCIIFNVFCIKHSEKFSQYNNFLIIHIIFKQKSLILQKITCKTESNFFNKYTILEILNFVKFTIGFYILYTHLAQNKSKISKSTFYRKLAKSNISTPRKESRAILKNLDINLVKQMRDEGKFYKEIADYFHVSEDRLRKNLKKQL